jgi:hypothetical protein
MFPRFSRLVLRLFTLRLENDEVIAQINTLQNLEDFVIDGQLLGAQMLREKSDNFLKKLQIKNLERIEFEKYEFSSPQMTQNFDTFTKNHPNIKCFKVETSDFGLATVEVIVKNLKQLEKLIIKTPISTFKWNIEDLKQLRESQKN